MNQSLSYKLQHRRWLVLGLKRKSSWRDTSFGVTTRHVFKALPFIWDPPFGCAVRQDPRGSPVSTNPRHQARAEPGVERGLCVQQGPRVPRATRTTSTARRGSWSSASGTRCARAYGRAIGWGNERGQKGENGEGGGRVPNVNKRTGFWQVGCEAEGHWQRLG